MDFGTFLIKFWKSTAMSIFCSITINIWIFRKISLTEPPALLIDKAIVKSCMLTSYIWYIYFFPGG